MTEPWNTEHGKKIWKTASEYFVWVRGQLRQIWSNYPIRTEWKDSKLVLVTPEIREKLSLNKQTKRVGQCALCEQWFAGSKLECDHIEESDGCYSFETAEKFLWHCAAQDVDNFQLVCKPCHKIKSYSCREEITFEEARAIKEAILICKEKRDKEYLKNLGIPPLSNAKARRKQIEEILIGKIN
jgi:hypothetical protein